MNTLRRTVLRPPIVIVVTCSLMLTEVAPVYARGEGSPITVAFLGFRYEDLNPEIQNRIEVRVLGLLYQQRSFQVLSPAQVRNLLGAERVTTNLRNPSPDSLRAVSRSLNVDYVLTGHLKNLGKDAARTVLEGQIIRYDRKTNDVRADDVLRYYDEFDLELAAIQRELIDTMLSSEGTFLQKNLPILVVGAIVVAGFVILIASSVNHSTVGSGSTPPTTTH